MRALALRATLGKEGSALRKRIMMLL
jgi:hypothetical protein